MFLRLYSICSELKPSAGIVAAVKRSVSDCTVASEPRGAWKYGGKVKRMDVFFSRRMVYGVDAGPMWKFVISLRNSAPSDLDVRVRSGQVVGSKGNMTWPVYAVQLQVGAVDSRRVSWAAGHQRRLKSKAASGKPWISWPPQFLVSVLVALVRSWAA